jgi:spore germination protein YaaH
MIINARLKMKKLAAIFLFLHVVSISIQAQEPPRSIHEIMLAAHRDEAPIVLQQAEEIIPLQSRAAGLSHKIYGYLPYWSSYASLDYSLLSTIAFFSIEIDGNGNITNRHGWPNADLINRAHARGVRIDLVATLFDDNAIHNVIANSSARDRFINNAIAEVKRGADGLNIDFEFSPSADRDLWTAFMNELAMRLKAELPNAQLSMAAPAVNWSDRYDRNALARICDVLFIMGYDYYYSGSPNAGPVSPLTGGTYNVTNSVNDYLSATFNNRSKLVLGCAYYGIDWPTVSDQPLASTTGTGTARFYSAAEAMAAQYGKLFYAPGQVPWFKYQNPGWRQCFYDDSTSLSKKYDLAKQKGLAGVGMWALGYDEGRTELWQALRTAFASGGTVPPPTPVDFWITARDASSALVNVDSTITATSYLFYHSLDGVNFDQGTFSASPNFVAANLASGGVHYYRVRAVNASGQSEPTEVMAIVVGKPGKILLVNGFDRLTGTVNTRDFVRQHGPAILAAGYGFDSCNNDALIHNRISMRSYDAVDWIAGEEGASTSSFDLTEQNLLRDYLQGAHRLFVSGSEIGYDLVSQGNQTDRDFYRNIFHAEYVADDTGVHSAQGMSGTIWESLPVIAFDDGTHGGYDVDYPDGIRPVGDAKMIAIYNGVNPINFGGAAIHWAAANNGPQIIYMAFPFEMIYDAGQRHTLMQRVLEAFGIRTEVAQLPAASLPKSLTLYPNFPNPLRASAFNSATTLSYNLPDAGRVKATLFNVLGQSVRELFDEWQAAGEHRRSVDLRDLPSGVYFLRLQNGREVRQQKWILQR